jgi:hypothetical protein
MLVGLAYFPHLRDAEDARMMQELERRRIADERAPRVGAWQRLAAPLAEHRRRVAEHAGTVAGAVSVAGSAVLPECAAD